MLTCRVSRNVALHRAVYFSSATEFALMILIRLEYSAPKEKVDFLMYGQQNPAAWSILRVLLYWELESNYSCMAASPI